MGINLISEPWPLALGDHNLWNKEQVMSKTGYTIILWLQSCINNDRSVFMKAFQEKAQNLLKVKKKKTVFYTLCIQTVATHIYLEIL